MTGDGGLPPEETFESHRPRLLGLAYRILSSRAEAEDVVQEVWMRFSTRTDEIRDPAAWLTTVTSRLALDQLRSARRRREHYVGPWLPEPLATDLLRPTRPPDPAESADLAASLTLGFLVVLDQLSPEDRVVFLLADVFATPFDEISAVVGRSPEACRQAASRARRRVKEAAPPPGDDPRMWATARELVASLVAGERDRMVALLAPDVVLVADGGAERHAARRPVVGAGRVARFLVSVAARAPAGAEVALGELNARPAVVVRLGGAPIWVMVVEPDRSGAVRRLMVLLAPDKLERLDEPVHLD